MTQTTVETFNVPATYVATQLLVCTERETVQDATRNCATLVSVTTQHKILTEREHSCSAAAEREIVLDEKKRICYIGLDYDREETYGLPDGSIHHCGRQTFTLRGSVNPANFI